MNKVKAGMTAGRRSRKSAECQACRKGRNAIVLEFHRRNEGRREPFSVLATRIGDSMAEIILLAERRGGGPVPSPVPPKESVPRKAEILFFTGVRYERLDDTPADDTPLPRKGRPRRAGKR